MTGFIITKYHELNRFFIKNFTRMSLKLEKPEKIRISFKCYLYSNKKKFLESPRHANGYQYAKIYLFHAFHDHFTLYIIGEETFTSYGPMGTCSSLSAHCALSVHRILEASPGKCTKNLCDTRRPTHSPFCLCLPKLWSLQTL